MARRSGLNIENTERALELAQRELEAVNAYHEKIVKQIEDEMRELERLRKERAQISENTAAVSPRLGTDQGDTFQSQYDKFIGREANKRLEHLGPHDMPTYDFTGLLKSDDEINQRNDASTGSTTFDKVDTSKTPGTMYYVSGEYQVSGGGKKQYEYIAWPTAGEIKVGQIVDAPVHALGYHVGSGKNSGSHNLPMRVTRISTQESFTPYHDFIK